jgi:hypothetical protein
VLARAHCYLPPHRGPRVRAPVSTSLAGIPIYIGFFPVQ